MGDESCTISKECTIKLCHRDDAACLEWLVADGACCRGKHSYRRLLLHLSNWTVAPRIF
jgi:hypothetical protein